DALSSSPRVKGTRHNIQGQPAGFCLQPAFVQGVQAVGGRGLTFDLCATHDQLRDVADLVRQCPDTRFVLDHCGKPAIRTRRLDPWRADVARLAAHDNVWCKLSGLLTEANPQDLRDDTLIPYTAWVVGAGARVAVVDVAEPAAEQTVREIAACSGGGEGGESVAVLCDVSRQADVAAAFEKLRRRYGTLDVLVNSAGIAHVGNLEQTSEQDLDRLYAVNVKGVYNCMQAAVPVVKARGGVILSIASVASSVGMPARFADSMTKGAVLTMTYSVARDYVTEKVRCNCIAP